MGKTAYESNIEHSISMGIKFDFFFVGLTFSILALAVKTTIDIPYLMPRLAEVCGWISLLISGYLGVSRLEWKPVALENAAKMASTGTKKQELEEAKLTGGQFYFESGKEAIIEDVINKYKDMETLFKKALDEQEESLKRKYSWRNRTFYAGICALMISRGWEHFQYFYSLF